MSTEWKPIQRSKEAELTINKIRQFTETLKIRPNPKKSLIRLNNGDPARYEGFEVAKFVTDAIHKSLDSGLHSGYTVSYGSLEARTAVSKWVSTNPDPVSADDVIMTSGCSHALEFAISVLATAGQNVLIPNPAFNHYSMKCEPRLIEYRCYNLLMDQEWKADLNQMESLIDKNTRAIIICNPDNPTGCVHSKQHLEDILKVANKHKIPIISDETYENLAFGTKFYSMASLRPAVPMLICSSISKSFLVPGYRLGWLIIYDRYNVMTDVRAGLRQLAGNILGPSSILQGALPEILSSIPTNYFENLCQEVSTRAEVAYKVLSQSEYLVPIMPKGGFYLMAGIKLCKISGIETDRQFVEKLLEDEAVWCLPGDVFGRESTFRIVLLAPVQMLQEACERIVEFTKKLAQNI